MEIADKITYWKNKKKLTTNGLAKMAGIAQSTLREIELKNTSPSWDTIEKLCFALNITTIQLIATNEEVSKEQTYDEKIKNLPEKDRKIIDTIIEVNKPKEEQSATAEGG